MARKGDNSTVREEFDAAWAKNVPQASRPGRPFYHGGNISEEALEILRAKTYIPTHLMTLEGPERVHAIFEAAQNGVFDPSPAQIKLIELHLKQAAAEKKREEEEGKRQEVLDWVDMLAAMASKERPGWVKKEDVGVTPTPAPEPELGVKDIMEELF